MKKGILLGLALAALPAVASEGEVDYRQNVLKAVGGHMQSMADIVRQKVPHTAHMSLHANAMADMASIAHTLFPPTSTGGDALPAIWTNTEDFARRVTTFEEAATGLKAAVDSGDGVGPAFQALAQACRDCHDNYRKK